MQRRYEAEKDDDSVQCFDNYFLGAAIFIQNPNIVFHCAGVVVVVVVIDSYYYDYSLGLRELVTVCLRACVDPLCKLR